MKNTIIYTVLSKFALYAHMYAQEVYNYCRLFSQGGSLC